MGRAPVALRQARILLVLCECLLVTDKDLGLYAADAGEGGEAIDQMAEKVAIARARQNFLDGLEGDIFAQCFVSPCVAYPADLGAAYDGEQIEIVKRAGRLREGETETLAKNSLGKIHFENRCETEGHF